MTNDRATDLGRRAVACQRWQWMPGMRAIPDVGQMSVPLRLDEDHAWPHDLGLRLPDLSDPATLGCLLALVREAWGSPLARVSPWEHSALPGGVKWMFGVGTMQPGIEAPTEAAALLTALESAP